MRGLTTQLVLLPVVASLLAGAVSAQDAQVDDIVRRLSPKPVTRAFSAVPTRRIEVVPGQQDLVLAATNEAPSIDLRILFRYDSDELTPEGAAALKPVGRALLDPRLASSRLLIAGHTDAQGSDAYNQLLSERRARSVREHLVLTFKIAPARLDAMGFGRRKPVDAAHPESHINRRVEIVNIGQ